MKNKPKKSKKKGNFPMSRSEFEYRMKEQIAATEGAEVLANKMDDEILKAILNNERR